MIELKVRKFGNSLGVVLPKEVIARLHTRNGLRLFLIEAPYGNYRLTPYGPRFEKKVAKAEQIMARYRYTLHTSGGSSAERLGTPTSHVVEANRPIALSQPSKTRDRPSPTRRRARWPARRQTHRHNPGCVSASMRQPGRPVPDPH